MRVLLTGAGTGGHTFPLLAVSRQIKQLNNKAELVYLGADSFSRKAFQQEGIKTRFILSAKLRRYFSPKTILDMVKLPISLLQALFWVFIIMPDVVFSKGGPSSLMVVLAAWLYHIPIIIHESDSVPGLSNRLAGRLAKRVGLAFEKASVFFPSEKIIVVGNPLRISLIQANKEEAQAVFKIKPDRPVLLIVGGSQGAKFLNEVISPILPELLQKYQVIHVSGQANYKDFVMSLRGGGQGPTTKQSLSITKAGAEIASSSLAPLTTPRNDNKEQLTSYHVYAFLDEKQMALAYAIADLVLARSGAGAIFELAANAKPCILVPLPEAAGDHQRINAYEYGQTGAAMVLEQPNLREHILLQRISSLLDNPQRLIQMSQAARQFAKPEAAKTIAQEIIKLAST